jgi:hypothetical protein
MNQPWYIATESFTPNDGEKWKGYVAWSGLAHLEEVVTLDQMLCPTLLPEIKDSFWPHIVNQDFLLNYFVDLDFLLTQVPDVPRKNLLCVVRDPSAEALQIADTRFEIVGFDLLETDTATSALVNCGGFPRAFQNGELNSKGLLSSLSRAREVQLALRAEYPEEHHALCDVWQVSRAVAL